MPVDRYTNYTLAVTSTHDLATLSDTMTDVRYCQTIGPACRELLDSFLGQPIRGEH